MSKADHELLTEAHIVCERLLTIERQWMDAHWDWKSSTERQEAMAFDIHAAVEHHAFVTRNRLQTAIAALPVATANDDGPRACDDASDPYDHQCQPR